MQQITPFLWFNTEAEEAANYYLSIFKAGKLGNIAHGPQGAVMVVDFEINGQKFIALNGGPAFKFNEAVSFVINCAGQDEIDYYWERLSAGGSEGQCGWLKDKYGLSWQVVPTSMGRIMTGSKAPGAAMLAMMGMKKLDIAALERAAAGA